MAPNGGISSEFWFGIEPNLGRDVFMQLVYGIRTSLLIAVVATILTATIGVVVGIVAGYAGGKTDYFIGRVIDLMLSFPQMLFFIAFMPVVDQFLVPADEETPVWLRAVDADHPAHRLRLGRAGQAAARPGAVDARA